MNVSEIDAAGQREATAGTTPDPQFPGRWSPRAMSGALLDQDIVDTLLEAARWAPSCFNAQPWRFAWAARDTAAWEALFATLVEGNQTWAQHAGGLLAVISRREFEHNGKPADTHAFDAGAAWMSLALQADRMGIVSHGMRGFDKDAARAALGVPDVYDLHAIIAIGHPGDIDDLPEPYREREQLSPRKALAEIAFEGNFEGLES